MATLGFGFRGSKVSSPGWVGTFRATDAWVVSAWEASAAMAPGANELSRQLRRGALECGTCLVAAAQCDPARPDRGYVEQARRRLLEARYVLYLARRFAAIDSRRYRTLSANLDRALREVSSIEAAE